jgi:hypothetical protein
MSLCHRAQPSGSSKPTGTFARRSGTHLHRLVQSVEIIDEPWEPTLPAGVKLPAGRPDHGGRDPHRRAMPHTSPESRSAGRIAGSGLPELLGAPRVRGGASDVDVHDLAAPVADDDEGVDSGGTRRRTAAGNRRPRCRACGFEGTRAGQVLDDIRLVLGVARPALDRDSPRGLPKASRTKLVRMVRLL